MKACASASGGVIFIPENVERKIPKIAANTSNDNRTQQEGQAQ